MEGNLEIEEQDNTEWKIKKGPNQIAKQAIETLNNYKQSKLRIKLTYP